MKQTLYEIVGDYLKLYEYANDEEMSENFEQMLKDTKESLDYSLEEKAFNYAKVCKNLAYKRSLLQGQEKFLKEELERIKQKIKASENNEKRIKTHLLDAMKIANISKFKNELFTIYEGKSTSVEVTDNEKALEYHLATISITPDKELIKQKLKAGETFDFAFLKESSYLAIR